MAAPSQSGSYFIPHEAVRRRGDSGVNAWQSERGRNSQAKSAANVRQDPARSSCQQKHREPWTVDPSLAVKS